MISLHPVFSFSTLLSFSGKRTKTLVLPWTVPKYINSLSSPESDREETFQFINGDVGLRFVHSAEAQGSVVSTGPWIPAPGHLSDSVHLLLSERKGHCIFLFLFLPLLLPTWPGSTNHCPWDSCAFLSVYKSQAPLPSSMVVASQGITVPSVLHGKRVEVHEESEM